MRSKRLIKQPGNGILLLTLAVLIAASCAVKRREVMAPVAARPALEASADQLVERYNQVARGIRSLNAGIVLVPTVGSRFTGVIEEYREVRGFLLAQKPTHIRLIGQAPVVAKNIFDMVSDGETFRIFLPSKNRFVTGPAEFERRAEKPIENLRPQHLLDAIFWPELPAGRLILFEELDAAPERYYILTQLRERQGLEIARKLWFDRADLSLARIQIYAPGGRLAADVRYADWQPLADLRYPRHIRLARPQDDYQLELRITKLTLNEDISIERFRLDQPPGTELVHVGPERPEARP